MTDECNPTPCNNPPNIVLNVPDDPNSYPSLSDYFLLNSSDSSDAGYTKRERHTKKKKMKRCSKKGFNDPIKKWANITAKVIRAAYNSNATEFKLDEDPLHRQVYLISFISYLKIILSKFKHNYMLLREYPSITCKTK